MSVHQENYFKLVDLETFFVPKEFSSITNWPITAEEVGHLCQVEGVGHMKNDNNVVIKSLPAIEPCNITLVNVKSIDSKYLFLPTLHFIQTD